MGKTHVRRGIALVLLALILSPQSVLAGGKLDQFEKELSTPSSPSSPSAPSHGFYSPGDVWGEDDDEDCVEEPTDLVVCAILELVFTFFAEGTKATLAYAPNRPKGAPGIPFARADITYQNLVDTSVQGLSARGEAGWTLVGVGYEFLHYWEELPPQPPFGIRPTDKLSSWTVEGLYRMSNEYFRLDIGIGGRSFERLASHRGAQAGFSVGIYPVNWLALESDLRWANINRNALGDYRVSAGLRLPDFQYASVRAGYRWIVVGEQALHGPEVGLTLTW